MYCKYPKGFYGRYMAFIWLCVALCGFVWAKIGKYIKRGYHHYSQDWFYLGESIKRKIHRRIIRCICNNNCYTCTESFLKKLVLNG